MGDFIDKAEQIIQKAKQEAKKRNGDKVEDIDILLALLESDEQWGSITYSSVVSDIEKIMGTKGHSQSTAENMEWSNCAQKVLNDAREIAKGEGCPFCEIRHLTTALLKSEKVSKIILSKFKPGGKTPPVSLPDKKQMVRTHIRWLIPRDMPEVLAIESASFEFPWSEDDFIRCLCQRNCIGMIAEHENLVVGFMVYELNKSRIHILNFATLPEMRRRGVGTQMVRKLAGKLRVQCRTRILIEVRETNLVAQLFFRDAGFRAISILRDYHENIPEDAYLMQYHYSDGLEFCSEEFGFTDSGHQKLTNFSPINRISRLAG